MTQTTIAFKDLPVIGADLAGGTFAGIITQQDGTHAAVILLANHAKELTWQAAMDWAAEQGGQLPTRPIASMLLSNVKKKLKPGWHWTCEPNADYPSYAWHCGFLSGQQDNFRKSHVCDAVAVRLIPIGDQP